MRKAFLKFLNFGHMPVKTILALGGMALATHAFPHHSASQFDFAKNVEVQGKIMLVDISNPHIDLILEIANSDGSTKEVQFEGHSRNNVYRRGWRPDMMEEGDSITIFIAPMRNGEDGGYIQSFDLGNGIQF